MFRLRTFGIYTFPVLALACSSVAAPTGWETDRSASPTAPATEGANPTGDPSAPGGGGPTGDAGADPTDAGGDPDPDPTDPSIYNTPVQCSSGTQWTQGDTKSDMMQPGSTCRKCHVTGGAGKKSFDVSGTVYATAHEPTDCNGVNVSGATIVITDANGASTSLTVNAAGNFYHNDLFGLSSLAKPFKAKVVHAGKQRVMVGTITDGDCNKCHTQSGATLAPGRIMLP